MMHQLVFSVGATVCAVSAGFAFTFGDWPWGIFALGVSATLAFMSVRLPS